MKPLLPTLKEKKRYLKIEIRTPVNKDHSQELLKQLKATLGLFDSAEAGLQKIKKTKQNYIIRCSVKSLPKVKMALLLITKLANEDARLRITKISGILNKIEE